MSAILYGVGIGPGDPRYLTLRAAEVLKGADVLFTVISKNAEESVSQQVVEWLHPRGEIRLLTFSMSRDRAEREAQVQANADAILLELRKGRSCAFATLGDAMTYSTFGYVLRLIRQSEPDIPVEIVPGITSFAALAARSESVLAENGEQFRVIPSFKSIQIDALEFPKHSTTILLKTYRNRKQLLDRITSEEGLSLVYAEKLGMEGELVLRDPEAIRERPETYLSLMMVKKS